MNTDTKSILEVIQDTFNSFKQYHSYRIENATAINTSKQIIEHFSIDKNIDKPNVTLYGSAAILSLLDNVFENINAINVLDDYRQAAYTLFNLSVSKLTADNPDMSIMLNEFKQFATPDELVSLMFSETNVAEFKQNVDNKNKVETEVIDDSAETEVTDDSTEDDIVNDEAVVDTIELPKKLYTKNANDKYELVDNNLVNDLMLANTELFIKKNKKYIKFNYIQS